MFGTAVLTTTLSFYNHINHTWCYPVLAVIMFKFTAIKDGIVKYGGMLVDIMALPKFLKEKVGSLYKLYW